MKAAPPWCRASLRATQIWSIPLRDLIYDHPGILPLTELEPAIGRVVAVAKEFNLPGAGFADGLM